jgi:wobble nucleotide-excising tRNase|tara:strand:- start:1855 stop:2052 length:198 start_codon:yes stop_codon:yes gene_type:complete
MIEDRGPLDLTYKIEQLEKQKKILQDACRRAGKKIKELEDHMRSVKVRVDRIKDSMNSIKRWMKR